MTTSSAPTLCAPCLADLALVREAVTAVNGTAACMAHAVLLTHPGDTAQRRLQRLSELRGLAEGKLETASTEDQPKLELLVQEYALAGAMDMTVPLRELAGERTRPGRPERGRNRPGRGDREHRPDSDGGERPERGERSERPERGERGERPERGERSERGPRGERGGRGRGDRGPRPGEETAAGAPAAGGPPVAATSGDGTSPIEISGPAAPFGGDAGVTQSPGEAADAQIAPSTPQPTDSSSTQSGEPSSSPAASSAAAPVNPPPLTVAPESAQGPAAVPSPAPAPSSEPAATTE